MFEGVHSIILCGAPDFVLRCIEEFIHALSHLLLSLLLLWHGYVCSLRQNLQLNSLLSTFRDTITDTKDYSIVDTISGDNY